MEQPKLISLWIPIVAMAITVLISHILVQFLMGDWMTWSALTYPMVFIITALTNQFYGPTAAGKVVLYGFFTGIVCSFVASQLTDANGIPYVTLRITIASASAFIVAQLVDIFVFNKLQSLSWWRAPLIASFVAALVDTMLFFTIAFSSHFMFLTPSDPPAIFGAPTPIFGLFGSAPLWVSLAIADFCVKVVIIFLALLPFRAAIKRHKSKNITDAEN